MSTQTLPTLTKYLIKLLLLNFIKRFCKYFANKIIQTIFNLIKPVHAKISDIGQSIKIIIQLLTPFTILVP